MRHVCWPSCCSTERSLEALWFQAVPSLEHGEFQVPLWIRSFPSNTLRIVVTIRCNRNKTFELHCCHANLRFSLSQCWVTCIFGALITDTQYKNKINRREKAKTVSRNSMTTVCFYAVVLKDSSFVTCDKCLRWRSLVKPTRLRDPI